MNNSDKRGSWKMRKSSAGEFFEFLAHARRMTVGIVSSLLSPENAIQRVSCVHSSSSFVRRVSEKGLINCHETHASITHHFISRAISGGMKKAAEFDEISRSFFTLIQPTLCSVRVHKTRYKFIRRFATHISSHFNPLFLLYESVTSLNCCSSSLAVHFHSHLRLARGQHHPIIVWALSFSWRNNKMLGFMVKSITLTTDSSNSFSPFSCVI
jgi:hypothetical protein